VVLGLSEGDVVWGAVRGTTAWPGKIVSTPDSDTVLVRWFGGAFTTSPTRMRRKDLKTLSEGLDAHHRASNAPKR